MKSFPERPRSLILTGFLCGILAALLPAWFAALGTVATMALWAVARSLPLVLVPVAFACGFALEAVRVDDVHRVGLASHSAPASGHRARMASASGSEGVLAGPRAVAAAALRNAVPGEAGQLLVGMALGDDSGLASSTREEFRRSSLTHVTAASGQNVVLLLGLLFPLLAALGVGGRARLAVCAVAAIAYVPMAGGESPIRRACVMALCALLARGGGAKGSAWHALAAAAAVTLIADPGSLRSLGWQLSFVAVGAMIVLGPRLALGFRAAGLARVIAEPLAATVSATVATTPLLAHAVGRLSLTAIPANLLAEPAVAAAMTLALLATALAQLAVPLAAPFAWAAALPAAAVLEVARIFAAPDWAAMSWHPGIAATALAVIVPVALGRFVPRRPRRRTAPVRGHPINRAVALLAVALAMVSLSSFGRTLLAADVGNVGPRISFIDVGQGDAELIADGDRGILVDTGPPGTPIARLVAGLGVRRLDALVLTHGQADHVGALADLLGRYRPRVVIDGTRTAPGGETRSVSRLLAAVAAEVREPGEGDAVRVGRVGFRVLSPLGPAAPGEEANDRSIVGRAEIGGLSAVLTADAESNTLAALSIGEVDLLKVAHHGSSDPGLEQLLGQLRPRLSVIEVGRNPYGHPRPSTLTALGHAGPYLRTDLRGTITVRPRADNGLEWESSRSA